MWLRHLRRESSKENDIRNRKSLINFGNKLIPVNNGFELHEFPRSNLHDNNKKLTMDLDIQSLKKKKS